MSKFTMILLVVLAAGAGAGLFFLNNWDIPAPKSTIEKTIPNDRFPK